MRLSYYGHACFAVETGGKKLLFDPFITGNSLATHIDLAALDADYILISHGHADHIADCIAIAQSTNAKVICNWEIHEWLNRQRVTNTHPMNTGGYRDFQDFKLKAVVAQHSSSLPDGSYGGNPMGFIVYTTDGNFYYSGDTSLTLDMQLIPKWAKLNFAVLPIGDNFTMGATDATECARIIECPTVVGVHYDTFGYIIIDKQVSIETFRKQGIELLLPNIGETITI